MIDWLILDLYGYGIGYGVWFGIKYEGQYDYGGVNQYYCIDQFVVSVLFLWEFRVKIVVVIVGVMGSVVVSI